jgi:uncharacterized repeat protein (TIGR03803 family)
MALAGLAFAPAAAQAAHFRTLYSFTGGADGANPIAALTWYGGLLYGFTTGGGALSMGVVFTINPTTGAETVLHDFDQMSFGEAPFPAMTLHSGLLYGTHPGGGATGGGDVFAVDTATGAETDVYDFNFDDMDGAFPQSGVIFVGDTIYGATQVGGAKRSHAGTVFRLDPATGAETVLHSFGYENGRDGVAPNGLAAHGNELFGTTETGANLDGVIFKIDATTGKERILHDFTDADGVGPQAGLVYAHGLFFGTAPAGGAAGDGTVFSFNPKTGKLTVLYNFTGKKDGGVPYAGLAEHDGTLYGTTSQGGSFQGVCMSAHTDVGCGTVFQLDVATGAYSVLHRFSGFADGLDPYAGVTYHGGTLYGVTLGDPSHGPYGTVFAVTP